MSPLKPLWIVWKAWNRADSRKEAPAAELRAAAAAELLARGVLELLECLQERSFQEEGGLVVVVLGAAVGLGDDPVDHAQFQAVQGIGLERGGGLLRLAGVPPEDRGAPFGGDHGVDRVLLHQHAVR